MEFKRGGMLGEFYTPLGAGIWVADDEKFRSAFRDAEAKLSASFGFEDALLVRSSSSLKYGIGLRRAIPFCDQLVYALQSHIKEVQINYVILPPSKVPEVEVGGLGSGIEKVKTAQYLRDLSPAFTHIMAWSFLGKSLGGVPDWDMHLDGFRSKYTQAWDELIKKVPPKVFPHGDECNPFVNIADLIAFMTSIKLGAQTEKAMKKLNEENVQRVWSAYSFRVNVHYFDSAIQYKLAWRSDDLIDLNKYYVRPMTFALIDDELKETPKTKKTEMDEIMENEPSELSGVKPKVVKRPKFRDRFERSEPGVALANYAYLTRGAFQHFDRYTDEDKIKDGDTLVYAGANSKHLAETYASMYDVKVLSMLELRKEVQNLMYKV